MITEYLTENVKTAAAGRAARLGGVFAGLAALLLAACSSSSSDAGPPPPPPPPPPPTNTAPTAAAGADMTVSTTFAVQLDGSASSDADGDAITYAWSFAFTPSGSMATFDDETAAQPSFTPDVAGDYTIELVVSDGTTTSSTDEVAVLANDNTVTQIVGPGGGQIASADGVLTLDIPAGALMTDESIALTLISDDQRDSYLGPEFDGIDIIDTVYDLSPTGLTFVIPATVSVLTADNPVTASGSIEGAVRFLASSDGTSIELLSDLSLFADANAGTYEVLAAIEHFSPLIWTLDEHDSSLTWSITGVPDVRAVNDPITVTAEVSSLKLQFFDAHYTDDRFGDQGAVFLPTGGLLEESPMARQGASNDFAGDFEYGCQSGGTVTDEYSASIEAELNPQSFQDGSALAEFFKNNNGEVPFVAYARKNVLCIDPTPAATRIATGIRATVGTTKTETVQAAQLLGQFLSGSGGSKVDAARQWATGSAPIGTNDPVGLFAGAEGNVLVNLLTGEVIRDATDPLSASPEFGAVLVSSVLPNGTPAGMLYSFGAGSFGGLRCDYDPVTQDFAFFCLTQVGTIYDAVPLGNTHESTQVTFATVFGVGAFELDPNLGVYEFSSDFDTATNAFFGTPYSAVRGDAAGPMLVISNNAPDYTWLSLVDPDGTVTEVQTFFGEDGRKLRCVAGLCVISVFNDGTGGALRFVTWDGINAPTVVDTTIPVGDGPVGIDLILLGNGNLLIVSTGFNDDTITLTEVTPAGALVSSNTDSVPTGCLSPGHATWYVPDGVPEDAQIVGTCYDSNQYYVLDIVQDPTDGFRIVPLQ